MGGSRSARRLVERGRDRDDLLAAVLRGGPRARAADCAPSASRSTSSAPRRASGQRHLAAAPTRRSRRNRSGWWCRGGRARPIRRTIARLGDAARSGCSRVGSSLRCDAGELFGAIASALGVTPRRRGCRRRSRPVGRCGSRRRGELLASRRRTRVRGAGGRRHVPEVDQSWFQTEPLRRSRWRARLGAARERGAGDFGKARWSRRRRLGSVGLGAWAAAFRCRR